MSNSETPPASSQQTATTPATPPINTPPTTSSTPSGKMLSQAEYDALAQRAANYDLIASDPQLSMQVLDHFKAKTGRISAATMAKTQQQPEPQTQSGNDAIYREMTARQAQLEVELFKMKHPDMDVVKDDMAKLINRYGMSLDDAYSFSMAAKSAAGQKPGSVMPTTPTTETNRTVGTQQVNDDLAAIEAKINDPKAVPQMDDAIELAWKAAKRLHTAQS